MPPFDLSQLQAMWDGIFPAIFGPLAAVVDTIGASVQGPCSPDGTALGPGRFSPGRLSPGRGSCAAS